MSTPQNKKEDREACLGCAGGLAVLFLLVFGLVSSCSADTSDPGPAPTVTSAAPAPSWTPPPPAPPLPVMPDLEGKTPAEALALIPGYTPDKRVVLSPMYEESDHWIDVTDPRPWKVCSTHPQAGQRVGSLTGFNWASLSVVAPDATCPVWYGKLPGRAPGDPEPTPTPPSAPAPTFDVPEVPDVPETDNDDDSGSSGNKGGNPRYCRGRICIG